MIKSISPKDAKKLIEQNSSLKLIDVREPWEHNRAKLDNSQLIPLKEFPNHLDKFEPKDSFLIYCHHGTRSFYACAYMMQQGFKEVYNLEGGIDAWSRNVDNSVPKY
jgi:rhodanese-related sulfurtransferase